MRVGQRQSAMKSNPQRSEPYWPIHSSSNSLPEPDFHSESAAPGSTLSFFANCAGFRFSSSGATPTDARSNRFFTASPIRRSPTLLAAETNPPGMGPLKIEVALLPLRHQGSTHSRVLGSVAADAGADWFGLLGAGVATLISVKTLDTTAPKSAANEPGLLAAGRHVRRDGLRLFSHRGRRPSRSLSSVTWR